MRAGLPDSGDDRPVGAYELEAQAFLAAIVDSSDDAIIGKTLDGTITSWNAAAEQLYGYTADEVVGRSISVIFPATRQDELDDILSRLADGERIHHYETERVAKDGTIVPISLSVSPIRDPDGTIVGASAIARDISRWREVEREREALLAEAQAASRAKSEFMASISHELRTPLNAILGYIDLIGSGTDEALPPNATRSVERIRISARHLLQLIEEILSFSRIESRGVEVQLGEVSLSEILDEVRVTMEPLAQAKGLRFTIDTAGAPDRLLTDPRKIRQILVNLLGNAVKFTEQGEVELTVRRSGDDLRMCVRDTGPGLAAEHLKHLFDPFWQADQTLSRPAGGTGLGLTIASRYVHALGGRIEVESEPGRGSTFTVELPGAAAVTEGPTETA